MPLMKLSSHVCTSSVNNEFVFLCAKKYVKSSKVHLLLYVCVCGVSILACKRLQS